MVDVFACINVKHVSVILYSHAIHYLRQCMVKARVGICDFLILTHFFHFTLY